MTFPPEGIPTMMQWWGLCGHMIPRAMLAYATGRTSHTRQAKGDDPDKNGYPGWVWGWQLQLCTKILLRNLIKDTGWITVVKRPRSYKNDDFYITTWNVCSLYGARMLKQNWKNKKLILQQFKGYNSGEVEYRMQGTSYWSIVVIKVKLLELVF